jgi:Tubulin like
MSDKSKLFVIGIGGSGAKCIESIVHLAAAGLYSEEEIEILFIDPDEANGNVERAMNSVRVYQDCQKVISGGQRQTGMGWMSTPIKSYGLWSPFSERSNSKDLASFFKYNSMEHDGSLANLFDVLYSPEERQQQLDEGFRGRPAIGAAVMSQVDLDQLKEEPWSSLIQSLSNDAKSSGKKPRILLCGSIFGGTGAAGVPTIAKLLRNKLKDERLEDTVKIGGVFLLPYFSFTAPVDESSRGLYAAANSFLLNTEAALRYYVTQASKLFDTVYVLGNENRSSVEFSVGKATQKNCPHFVELYAGLAARDFLHAESRDNKVMLVGREQVDKLSWKDLPESATVKKLMSNATRLAYMWLSDFEVALGEIKQEGFRAMRGYAPWASPYYDDRADSQIKFDSNNQQKEIELLTNWCRDYLRWIDDLHSCETDKVELFRTKSFTQKVQAKQFDNILIGDSRIWDGNTDLRSKVKEKVMAQRLDTIGQGTVGLAKSIYLNAELN